MVHKDLLEPFVRAKGKINAIFRSYSNFLQECSVLLSEPQTADFNNFSSQVSNVLAQVSSISEMIARDQMKVAFFGRTSSGKSTTVNAMLQGQILPMGMGHTTNCFVSVHGSDQPHPYILTAGSNDNRNAESLSLLVDALSDDNLGCSSLVQFFWPKTRCELLSEDVVLVDSPGIDVSSDHDSWIDKHCLDADVLVLVVNAESTLMMTEKKFFHKVKQRLSRPNIFILNNRWDASASEPDTMEQVKNQHLQREISFLVDELKCVERAQAEDRVFFVSSKETLMTRMQKQKGMLKEGFQARQKEFENFERKFEECISKSAIQTKFESHAVSGLETAKMVKNIMEQVVAWAIQQRSRLEEIKKEEEERLRYITERLEICSRNAKDRIETIKCTVEEQVADAMNKGIGRLESLVNEFDHPFHPHPNFLAVYKRELYNHLEENLNRNMTAPCSNSQTQVINNAQRDMADCLRSVLPLESLDNVLEPDASLNSKNSAYTFVAIASLFFKQKRGRFYIKFEIWMTSDFKYIVVFPFLCGGKFAIELFRLTNAAKTKAFKEDFVKYATERLHSAVSSVSANRSVQVQQTLTTWFVELKSLVQRSKESSEENINELCKEIARLEKIEKEANLQRNKASVFEEELSQFITDFVSAKCKI
ncbi:PREDICTED: mitofusin-2-like [Acropora digitifera]|uniref:mitofusin-2-like n=1 Tax=Acropora digitifera TaxID=70779 RepID=UPI00077AE957|nr:PREDICTED: mitofusin-2-like [Acropora digitifera]